MEKDLRDDRGRHTEREENVQNELKALIKAHELKLNELAQVDLGVLVN